MSDDPEAQIPDPETEEDPKLDEPGTDEDPKPDETGSEDDPKPENEEPEKTETEGGSRPPSTTAVGILKFFLFCTFCLNFFIERRIVLETGLMNDNHL